MWIILLFVYVTAALPNNAQEFTDFEFQTATETYANSDVNRDSTRPPVTLTIRNGRTENVDRTITQDSGPLYYSREWQRVLMPIGFNSDRDAEKYVNDNDRASNHQFVTTFLRSPDAEANNTVPNQYSLIEERNQFSDVPISYQYPLIYFQNNSNSTLDSNVDHIYADSLPIENAPRSVGNFQTSDFYRNIQDVIPVPFQSTSQSSSNVENTETITKQTPSGAEALRSQNTPRSIGNFRSFDLYGNTQNFGSAIIPFQSPSQSSLSSNVHNVEMNIEEKQIPTSAISELTNTDSTRINEKSINPLSTDNRNLAAGITNPANFYRNNQRYFPAMVPAYYPPYPVLPFQSGNAFQPIIPFPSNYPNFDRESGSEVNERIQVPQKEAIPGDVTERRVENVPSETAVNVIPPQPLPSVLPGYPFGPYLPPFASPFIPNIPSSGYPLRQLPLPIPRSVQGGDVSPDVPLPPPVIPVKPLADVLPEVLPRTGILANEDETSIITGAEITPEESAPVEENSLKIPYEFGFDMSDGNGNDQHRKEVSDISGVVTGSYGYRDQTKGMYRIVKYVADKYGFRANVYSNEPGVASSGSANVMVYAERPPPRVITEETNEGVPVITDVADPNAELIAAGSAPEIK